MDDTAAELLRGLLARQCGVVTRSQALACGVTDADLRRSRRRRDLTVVHPGVLVDHTGPLTWSQRAWAAVLACEPAALHGVSARRAADGPGRSGEAVSESIIHVLIGRDRRLAAPAGVRLHRGSLADDRVLWAASPARQRVEHATLDLASSSRRDLDAIGHLARAVQSRQTTAGRLLDAIESRPRLPRRRLLVGVLADVAAGACSTLEHGYLVRVERPHGLPIAERQVTDSALGPLYRDVEYRRQRFVVELDGRLGHDATTDRDRDLDRDLDALLSGRDTARLGWGQVFERPCATARKIGRALGQRGWQGEVRRCPRCGPG